MKIIASELKDVLLIEPKVFEDARGSFYESYHQRRLAEAGLTAQFVQDNHSHSKHAVLRGLHYQVVRPQGKLIRCVLGEVFDVAVDLRRSSPTFGRWLGTTLSAENRLQIYVPGGFAHGFLVLSETADVVYKCTDFYAPEHERTIAWNDPKLAIDWPLAEPILSDKDRRGLAFDKAPLFA